MAGTIFLNYRKEESISITGRLYDRLVQAFGCKNVFMDVDGIPGGVDFVTHLNSELAACIVVLVVIGPKWLGAKDEAGHRRLDEPDDYVAIEIAAALARDIRVIPVLIDGTSMPKANELPDRLKPLALRQASEIRQNQFGRDVGPLVETIREALDESARRRSSRGMVVFGATTVAALFLIGGWYVTLPQKMYNAESPTERTITVADGMLFQQALCVTPSERFDEPTRNELSKFNAAFSYPGDDGPDVIRRDKDLMNLRDAQRKFPDCKKAGFRNGFEVGLFARFGSTKIRSDLTRALALAGISAPATFDTPPDAPLVIDNATRQVIGGLATKYGLETGSEITPAFYDRMSKSLEG